MTWWRDAVIYQIYPRSFADTTGDGNGDLAGIRKHLDYLEWLGVDGIWLNPITPSPNADWGYDVSDYCDVHPDYGTLDDLDALVADAGRRGIRVVLDIVPNHSSDRHPWFVDARSSRSSAQRDWYVWADGKDGGPPNNWQSIFGGPAWTPDEQTGQYYLHNFLPQQPDLNWWTPAVADEFDRILRFWFGRGIAGFRIDVAHAIVKDRELRDEPSPDERVYCMNRPEVHGVYRRWRRIAEEYDPARLLLGETYVLDPAAMASYYGEGGDELQLAFNFSLVHAPFEAGALSGIVQATEQAIPRFGWPVWTGSNHDVGRFLPRWCGGDEAKARCALLALLTLRGTAVLYYGDELGLPDAEVPPDRRLDMAGRDGCRTPMPWSDEPGAGFTRAGVEPWLPFGPVEELNVAAQRDDKGSMLSFCRDLIALRREHPHLREGAYEQLAAPDGVWAWRRGSDFAVALNLGRDKAEVAGLDGSVLLGTDRRRDGEAAGSALRLGPAEGALVALRH
jgi:alpha-glucosidase